MKKYPKEWRDAFNVAWYKLHEESASTDECLDILNAAGMLKDVPKLLEIEYCVVHEALRGKSNNNKHKCSYPYVYSLDQRQFAPDFNPCKFVKFKEVVE